MIRFSQNRFWGDTAGREGCWGEVRHGWPGCLIWNRGAGGRGWSQASGREVNLRLDRVALGKSPSLLGIQSPLLRCSLMVSAWEG